MGANPNPRDIAVAAVALDHSCHKLRNEECPEEDLHNVACAVVDTAYASGLFYEQIERRPYEACKAAQTLWREVELALKGVPSC